MCAGASQGPMLKPWKVTRWEGPGQDDSPQQVCKADEVELRRERQPWWREKVT